MIDDPFSHNRKDNPFPTDERNDEIYRLWRDEGLTLIRLAQRYGLCKERTRQIIAEAKRIIAAIELEQGDIS